MTEDLKPARAVRRDADEFSSLFRIDPLSFERVGEDRDTVRWRAEYDDHGAPASPQFALHVEINRHYARQQPDSLLDNQMWGGFHLLAHEDANLGDDAGEAATGGEADEDADGVTTALAEPPDVIFRPELLNYDKQQADSCGFTMVVSSNFISPGPHRLHRWKVNPPFRAQSAQIKATSGRGRLQRIPGGIFVDAVVPNVSRPLVGTNFDVTALSPGGFGYIFLGRFHLA
jgi:hypothetical protein